MFPYGGVNSSSKSLNNEKKFCHLIADIVGCELFSEDDWSYLTGQCDLDDSKSFDRIIKSLSSATIAGAKYSASMQAKGEEKSSPIDGGNE